MISLKIFFLICYLQVRRMKVCYFSSSGYNFFIHESNFLGNENVFHVLEIAKTSILAKIFENTGWSPRRWSWTNSLAPITDENVLLMKYCSCTVNMYCSRNSSWFISPDKQIAKKQINAQQTKLIAWWGSVGTKWQSWENFQEGISGKFWAKQRWHLVRPSIGRIPWSIEEDSLFATETRWFHIK